MSDYRVLVTGSRDWRDHETIRSVLDACRASLMPGDVMVVVHGDNKSGADAIAAHWVRHTFRYGADGVPVAAEPHPADWLRLGKRAGAARNQEMADKGARVCYAFYWAGAGNIGTADCAERARGAGIPVGDYHGGPE
jgi:YspA, cpYpsA-related SLOG family